MVAMNSDGEQEAVAPEKHLPLLKKEENTSLPKQEVRVKVASPLHTCTSRANKRSSRGHHTANLTVWCTQRTPGRADSLLSIALLQSTASLIVISFLPPISA
jgi:hypothetical protein